MRAFFMTIAPQAVSREIDSRHTHRNIEPAAETGSFAKRGQLLCMPIASNRAVRGCSGPVAASQVKQNLLLPTEVVRVYAAQLLLQHGQRRLPTTSMDWPSIRLLASPPERHSPGLSKLCAAETSR